MNRRALLGVGVLGASAAAGVGAFVLRDDARFSGALDGAPPSRGRANVEAAAFLADTRTVEALRRRRVAATVTAAPSVELASNAQAAADWLWPAAAPATARGAPRLVFTSPLVFFSWEPVARRLADAGLVRDEGDGLRVDTRALLAAATEGTSARPAIAVGWPARSDSGLLFAALAEAVDAGRERRPGLFAPDAERPDMADFLAAGPDVMPLRVGFENELVRRIAADPAAWSRRQASAGDAQPVTLYPSPTIMAQHVIVPRGEAGERLAEALLSPELQALGRSAHGFRGPQGQPASGEAFGAAQRTPARLTDVLPTPSLEALSALARSIRG